MRSVGSAVTSRICPRSKPKTFRPWRGRALGVRAAAMPLSIGLDVGTQGTKALVYDWGEREVVGRGSVSYSLDSTRPGMAEQDPAVWLDAVRGALEEALAGLDASRVRALGVSGQQHGLVALDSQGAVLRPAKLWCDVEAAAEAEELSAAYGATLVPSFTAPKLLWLKRREPEAWAALAHVLLPHDYVNHWLTGRYVMERSDASGTGALDPVTQRWDECRMRAIDAALPAAFPELIGPDEAVGTLLPGVARELGLPEGVVVSPGGGDNAMAALGAGAVEEGVWVLSLGTSGTLFGPSNRPVLDPTGVVCPFSDATGKWLPLLCTINCTGVTEEVRAAFGLSHEAITELAAREAPGALTFLPYLGGERTPNWPQATGAILGLRPGLLKPGVLFRSAMEGATFSLLAGLHRLRGHGLAASELRVVGGGSANKLWRRVIADAFQLPLRFPVEKEAAALGAALQAAAVFSGQAVGEFVAAHPPAMELEVLQPNHQLAEAYGEAFRRHTGWADELFGGGSSVA